jgi:hypothetical protein
LNLYFTLFHAEHLALFTSHIGNLLSANRADKYLGLGSFQAIGQQPATAGVQLGGKIINQIQATPPALPGEKLTLR